MQNDLINPAPSQSTSPAAPSGQPAPSFIGNTNDLMAIIAGTVAIISGVCCLSGGYGIYCLPVVGVVLGGLAVANARSSVDPSRTRQWGWIGLGVSGAVLLLIAVAMVCVAVFYGALILAAVSSSPPNYR